MSIMRAALDVDVVGKLARFDLFAQALSAFNLDPAECGVLPTTQYVWHLANRQKLEKKLGSAKAADTLEHWLPKFQLIEATPHEMSDVLELVAAARKANAAVDEGEAILFVICATRGIPLLFMGDKRSLQALATLAAASQLVQALAGRVISFEQLIAAVISKNDFAGIRQLIAANLGADRTMAVIFASGSNTTLENANAGLASYVTWLRSTTGPLLIK